jgi:protein-disulfide isomerase
MNRVAQLVPPIASRDHILGGPAAPVLLVEYGDYECPHCGRAYVITKAAEWELGADLRFVFRHFPLRISHPHAALAAEAAEAAGAQGAFWQMHDLLFTNQDALERSDLLGYADQLRLDVSRVKGELATGIYAPHVQEDFVSGIKSGVNGTPTFFIDGVRYDGAWGGDGLIAELRRRVEQRKRIGGARASH